VIADLSLSGLSLIAALGVLIGAILAIVAYIAFVSGMFGLAEMGRLAKVQRLELEEQRSARERGRRLETEKLDEEQRLGQALRLEEERRRIEANNPLAASIAGQPAAKIPWWKYAPRETRT
jgi:hypothetical protein